MSLLRARAEPLEPRHATERELLLLRGVARAQAVLGELLKSSARLGGHTEAITTVATNAIDEIARVARLHRCQTVLLGLGDLDDTEKAARLEKLFGTLQADIVVVRAPANWNLSKARRILVPVASRGGHNKLLARMLGSLTRRGHCDVTFLNVARPGLAAVDERRLRRDLRRLAADTLPYPAEIVVIEHEDPVAAISDQISKFDLTILGMQRIGDQARLLTDFTKRIASCSECPLVVISRRV